MEPMLLDVGNLLEEYEEGLEEYFSSVKLRASSLQAWGV